MNVLLVDDEPDVLLAWQNIIMGAGHEVKAATNSQDALALVENELFNIVFTDMAMPCGGGVSFIGMVFITDKTLPVVAVTGKFTDHALRLAKSMGAVTALRKPVTKSDLLETLNNYARPIGVSSRLN